MARMWCDDHWRPYGAKRANGIAAQAFLMKSITDDDRWLSLIDRGDGVSDTSPEGMNRAMAKIAPACCWISPTRLEAILIVATEANVGVDNTLDGAALAHSQVAAFKAWQLEHRPDVN